MEMEWLMMVWMIDDRSGVDEGRVDDDDDESSR